MKQRANSGDTITKEYFENTLTRLLSGIRNEITFAIDGAVEKITINMYKTNDGNLTKLDSIVKELEEMREDRALGAYQTTTLREDIDDHEIRIKRIEKLQRIT